MKKINICRLANTLQAYRNCIKSGNSFAEKHIEAIEEMCKALPHGSGLDSGVKLNFEESTKDRIVFDAPFHCMDEWGSYDGWADLKVVVKPCLMFGMSIDIKGRDRNNLKDYLADLFSEVFEFEPNWQLRSLQQS